MDNPDKGPTLVDAAAVAGISIPPGTGSFLHAARRFPIEAPAAVAAAPATAPAPVSEGATEIAQEAPQAADNVLMANSAAPVVSAPPAAQVAYGRAADDADLDAAVAVAARAAPLPAQTATAASAVANTTAVLAPPRFVGGLRQRRYVLDYPIEYAGRVYDAITLRRPTSAEVGLFFEHLAVQAVEDPDGRVMLPVFVDDEGEPIPDAVIDFLDGADDERIGGVVADFLPPRLQRFQAELQSASTRPPGEPTEATS